MVVFANVPTEGLPYVRKISDMSGIQVFSSEIAEMSEILLKCPEFL